MCPGTFDKQRYCDFTAAHSELVQATLLLSNVDHSIIWGVLLLTFPESIIDLGISVDDEETNWKQLTAQLDDRTTTSWQLKTSHHHLPATQITATPAMNHASTAAECHCESHHSELISILTFYETLTRRNTVVTSEHRLRHRNYYCATISWNTDILHLH
jgi:hypothetical protein